MRTVCVRGVLTAVVLGLALVAAARASAEDSWLDRIGTALAKVERVAEGLDGKKADAKAGLEARVSALDQRVGDLEEKKGLVRGRVSIKPDDAWAGSMTQAVIDLDRRLKGTAAAPASAAPPPTPMSKEPGVPPQSSALKRGYIGISADPAEYLSKATRERLGIQAERGVVVWEVLEGGPARRAGLRVGDLITRYAGKAVPATDGVREGDDADLDRWRHEWETILRAVPVGKMVFIVGMRGEEPLTLSALAVDFSVVTMLRASTDAPTVAMFLDVPVGSPADALKACLPAVRQRLVRHGYSGIECSLDDDEGHPLVRLDAKSGFSREMRERVASLVRLACSSVELRCKHDPTTPEREQWTPPRAPDGMKWIPCLHTPDLTKPEPHSPISWYLTFETPVVRLNELETATTSDGQPCFRISVAASARVRRGIEGSNGAVLVIDGWVADVGDVRVEDGAPGSLLWFPEALRREGLLDFDSCLRNPLPFGMVPYAPR